MSQGTGWISTHISFVSLDLYHTLYTSVVSMPSYNFYTVLCLQYYRHFDQSEYL